MKGDKTLLKRLSAIIRRMPGETAKRMDNRAAELRGRAIAVAPELTRRLILSTGVSKRDRNGRFSVNRTVTFDTPYAVIQHEGSFNPGPVTSAKAPTQDGPAGRKYLERPYRNMIGEVQTDVGRAPMDVTRAVVRQVRGDA